MSEQEIETTSDVMAQACTSQCSAAASKITLTRVTHSLSDWGSLYYVVAEVVRIVYETPNGLQGNHTIVGYLKTINIVMTQAFTSQCNVAASNITLISFSFIFRLIVTVLVIIVVGMIGIALSPDMTQENVPGSA